MSNLQQQICTLLKEDFYTSNQLAKKLSVTTECLNASLKGLLKGNIVLSTASGYRLKGCGIVAVEG